MTEAEHKVGVMRNPNSKVHGANMGPTWVLSVLDGPHVGPMKFAIRVSIVIWLTEIDCVLIALLVVFPYHMV